MARRERELSASDVASPGQAQIVVGPDRRGVQRRHAFDVESGLGVVRPVVAREFAVKPAYDSAGGTGAAGWTEVRIPFVHDEGNWIQALVYYPAGRDDLGRLTEGEDALIAARPEGLQPIVLAHGLWPDQLCVGATDRYEEAFCDPDQALPEDRLFTLWRSTQRYLARRGYLTAAIDLRFRSCVEEPDEMLHLGADAVDAAIGWLVTGSPLSDYVAADRVAVAGHSAGAGSVGIVSRERSDIVAGALIAPSGGARLAAIPGLVVSAENDLNGATEDTYQNLERPRYLVSLSPQAQTHYSYYDGICSELVFRDNAPVHIEPEQATRQRRITQEALAAFFDRHLRGLSEVPDDLGLKPGDGIAEIRSWVHDQEVSLT